jgi:2,5-diketo-D-gluconate reductase A
MAAKYGVTEAQVLLRWGVQQGYVVLPKSTNPVRIRQNADLFSFTIVDEDMAAIAGMDRGAGVAWPIGDPTTFAKDHADRCCAPPHPPHLGAG